MTVLMPASVVEDAVAATVGLWVSPTLTAVETDAGVTPGTVARPRSLVCRSVFDVWAEQSLPAISVECPGTIRPPEQLGAGVWVVVWDVRVSAIVSAGDKATTRRMAQWYAAALRWVFLTQGSLGGLAAGTRWDGERYDELPEAQSRTVVAATIQLSVSVEVGPIDPHLVNPPDDPLIPAPGWPQVQATEVDVVPSTTPGVSSRAPHPAPKEP